MRARIDDLPGRLAENVMHFGRVLRAAGVPVGTDRIQLALQALQVGGLTSRRDFHAALQACMIDRAEHRALFDQAFHVFWRDPDLLGRVMRMLLPRVQGRHESGPKQRENRRLGAALFPGQNPTAPPLDESAKDPVEFEAPLTWSDRERLHHADFETMSAEEWQQAKRMLRALRPWFDPLVTRRFRPAASPGRADWRATLASHARSADLAVAMRWRRARTRPAPLVVLADISGSMSRYSRMLLHFAHALASGGADLRVSSFVFGTRLTPITRLLRQRDPDLAVARVSAQVADWSGGTRITECLHRFNRDWSRRVLTSSATVLLITDGLEHGDTAQLGAEAERLQKSCRRVLWLNPLLRYDGFEPRAAGIRALLPHVDALLPAHNLASLEQLARTLTETPSRG
jgi:uncharacterized protein with von Willebrand factor type A (vWA) domain